ncbi:hypothetical protein [Chryseobacterium potabilaquae]|uniref:Uncharacterized protein n=1 Tax=Chryseobacterium potabilaquae TaxID=2675057 RepID=A0A6N4X1T7_9FLAO|nr:hypothetical protein [Chryseobacterium potabilaquae]CAA7193773.1 hypothetical protein CHRY9293_00185 [Chryseobacterium potabilaquae]
MIKKLLYITILLSCSPMILCQNREAIDSLFATKDYLSEIKKTINIQEDVNKVQRIQKLIRAGSEKEERFKFFLKKIVNDHTEYEDMIQSFHWILQSLVLYKSDLTTNVSEIEKNSEKMYMNRHIPPLINQIYFYTKKFQEKSETHKN